MFRQSISKDHDILKKCLVGTEASILKRWKGWKEPKRRSAILSACPNIASKRFNRDVLLGKVDSTASNYRSQFLLYPMTAEVFSENYQAFLGLAHWRASTRPEDCVPFDWAQLSRGIHLDAFPKVFAPGCIRMVGAIFGSFQPFDDVDVHCSKAFPTAAALLILERQSMIYQMLCKVLVPIAESAAGIICSFMLYADGAASVRSPTDWYASEDRRFQKGENSETVFKYIDGIFLSPIPNVSDVLTLVQQRQDFFEDELASLSSDVEYFLCNCAEYQAMMDTCSQQKLETPLDATASAVLISAYQDRLRWYFLGEALQHLMTVMKKYERFFEYGQPRPIEYQKAFWMLSILAQSTLWSAQEDLHLFCSRSPELARSSIHTGHQQLSASNDSDAAQIEGLYRTDQLLCLLILLWDDSRNVPLVLPELKKLLLRGGEAKRLNFRIRHTISEISSLWRLVEFCRYQRPAVPDAERDFFENQFEDCLAVRYLTTARGRKMTEQISRGGALERHFDGLKVAKTNGGKNRAWLAAVDGYQCQLQNGMQFARELFLAMLAEEV